MFAIIVILLFMFMGNSIHQLSANTIYRYLFGLAAAVAAIEASNLYIFYLTKYFITPIVCLSMMIWLIRPRVKISPTQVPNQGIIDSGKNFIFTYLLYIFMSGLIAFPILSHLIPTPEALKNPISLSIPDIFSLKSMSAIFGSVVGTIFGLPSAFNRGGSSYVQHYSLRLLLSILGYIPQNYAGFLRYATERRFIQQVGGRYWFLHRVLQEHFANMPLK